MTVNTDEGTAGVVVGHVVDETQSQIDEATKEEVFVQGPIYVCRLAIALVRLPEDTPSLFTVPEARGLSETVEEALRTALDADTRVVEVYPLNSEFEIDNART